MDECQEIVQQYNDELRTTYNPTTIITDETATLKSTLLLKL